MKEKKKSPSKVNRSALGKKNKRKGSDGERYYAKWFRNLGFEHCKTSRLGSKLHDNAGIDLIFLPFNVQIKVGEQRGIKYWKELKYTKNQIKQIFPENMSEHTQPTLLIHRLPSSEKTRQEWDEVVTMTLEDFKKLITCQKN